MGKKKRAAITALPENLKLRVNKPSFCAQIEEIPPSQ